MPKLNNKGQTLILFVILLPFLLILISIFIDLSYWHKENNKLNQVTKTIIKNVYEKKEEPEIEEIIEKLFIKNNIDTENLKINVSPNFLRIQNSYEVDSIFGKIIGIKKYEVKVSLKGYIENNKIKVLKE